MTSSVDMNSAGVHFTSSNAILEHVNLHSSACRPYFLLCFMPSLDVGLAGLILLVIAAAIQPAMWVLAFALATSRRQCLLTYWLLLLACVLPLIHWISAAHAMPTILVRKGYHLLAVGLFLPALLWEPQLLAVSLAIALALLVVLEVLRLGQVPYLGGSSLCVAA